MGSRIVLGLLAIFWVVMTTLLWRSEYLGSNLNSIPVDPDAVWQRILTSPDSSSLAILQQGERIGFCHIITGVANSLDSGTSTNTPEGMIRDMTQYRLDFGGAIEDAGDGVKLRFDGSMGFSLTREWQDFSAQLIARPWLVTVDSVKAEDSLEIKIEGPNVSSRKRLRLSDLSTPTTLLSEVMGTVAPAAPALLLMGPLEVSSLNKPEAARWEASTERFVIGNNSSQGYRLELKPTDGIEVVILVSRAGEILKVELPQGYRMVNEALPTL